MKRKKVKTAAINSGITLSIGMIVKDEIRSIERCLKALDPLRKAVKCELIIADTGSTDGTREICEKYADTLIDFEWINDFAAARNATLDISRGSWYMFVDADEYLDKDIDELVEFVTHPDALRQFDAHFVVVRNYKLLDMENSAYSDFPALRVLRMSTGKRFQGAIHEGFDAKDLVNFCKLEKTIFHHDGYANDRGKEQISAKSERNMDLLRQLYKENPEELRIILQCIESCGPNFADERMMYISEGMRLITENEEKRNALLAVGIYKHAIKNAFLKNLPVWEKWYEFGKEHFSNSFYFKLEVMYAAILFFIDKKDYEQGLEAAELYMNGFEEYENSTKDILELIQSPLVSADEFAKQTVSVYMAFCYLKLEQKEKALKLIDNFENKYFNDQSIKYMLMVAEFMPSEAKIQDAVAMIMDEFYAYKGDDSNKKFIMAICKVGLRTAFDDFARKKFAAYSRCSGDVGLFARVCMENSKQNIESILADVKDFSSVPTPMLCHCIEHCVKLPVAFYAMSHNNLLAIANELAKKQSLLANIANFAASDDFSTPLIKQKFLFDLLSALLAGHTWNKDNSEEAKEPQNSNAVNYIDIKQEKEVLGAIELYKSTAKGFIEKMYTQDVTKNGDNYKALPPRHAFAVMYTRACASLNSESELEFVRNLRKAVETDKAMHSFIEFVISKAGINAAAAKKADVAPEVSAEMRALAVKIKQILSTFPKDSPAIAQLMQSEAYKQVAHIIDDV